VVVLDSVITHTSAWFLDRDIHQLVFESTDNSRYKVSYMGHQKHGIAE